MDARMVRNDGSIGAGGSNIRSDRAYRIRDRRVALESMDTLLTVK
jgi:hypothetical protein